MWLILVRASVLVLLFAVVCGCEREREFKSAGKLVGVNRSESTVTIEHPPIPGLLRASVSSFRLAAVALLDDVVIGDTVLFRLSKQPQGALELTFLEATAQGQRGVHDHTPHHGGVVVMRGEDHYEAVATASGLISLFLSDRWRKPQSVSGVSGTVTVKAVGTGPTEALALRQRDGALDVEVGSLAGDDVDLTFAISRGGSQTTLRFLLPFRQGGVGAGGLPLDGCRGVVDASPNRLRCVIDFEKPVTAIATRDGLLFVAAIDLGVSAWTIPGGEFVRGFEAPPPMRGNADEAAHVEAINSMSVSPLGDELAVTLENRIILYQSRTGALRGAYTMGTHILRDLAWSGEGANLFSTGFYDERARAVSARSGVETGAFNSPTEVSAVALGPDAKSVLVGNRDGQVLVFDTTGERRGDLSTGTRTVHDIATATDRVIAVNHGGVMVIWSGPDMREVGRVDVGTRLYAVAVAPSGDRWASAGMDGVLRIHRNDGAIERVIDWHRAQVFSVAWPLPETLVSGDMKGRVAIWDVGGGGS